jgi:3-hydroxybutyryl-CoA dehydratase
MFAGITGEFARNHVDEEYMKKSAFGRRIVHGALLVGFMSNGSSMIIQKAVASGIDETPVSVGYDRIAFSSRCSSAIRLRWNIQLKKRRSIAKI